MDSTRGLSMCYDDPDNGGFTLLEVLLAFGIVCICCAMVVSSVVSLERLSTVCSVKEQAVIALSNTIEAAKGHRKTEVLDAATRSSTVNAGHATVHVAPITTDGPVSQHPAAVKLTAEQHGARGLSVSIASAAVLEQRP
jgi:type II secretory pathway pseudopilin PulG